MTSSIESTVREIINNVKRRGDEALLAYSKLFDGADLLSVRVPEAVLKAAYDASPMALKDALETARRNLVSFHQLQRTSTEIIWETDEKIVKLMTAPLKSVGVYAPGGRAAYPSSVLMNVIPAQVAGVERIALFSPPPKVATQSPLYAAAWLLGIKEVYAIGGAQAIAAAAYGTESIQKVDMITGPGNAYVTEAKRQVFGTVAIDMLAGPTELMIIADDSAPIPFLAADLLAQAEHDPDAGLTLIDLGVDIKRLSESLSEAVEQTPESSAKESIDNLQVIRACDLMEAANIANRMAPEHLSLQTRQNDWLSSQITMAGSIFIGSLSTEALGDYACGSNHVLPTNGTARFASCLNVNTFLRRYQTIQYKALDETDFQASETLAAFEGLPYHKKSIEVRRRNDSTECK